MSDKFLNSTGLTALRNWITQKLGLKQDTLVSGTNIKTINSESILGSGNINISTGGSDVFVATYNVTPIDDIVDAWMDNKIIYYINPDGDTMLVTFCKGYDEGSGSWMEGIGHADFSEGYDTVMFWQDFNYNTSPASYGNYSETHIAGAEWVETLTGPATETTFGTIKLNPNESITLNSNNQLDVGGRLGQMSNTTGVYSPKTINPQSVGNGSFLLTEASGLKLGTKSLAVVTGAGLTVKSAAAGTTTYLVTNNYENKIICAGIVGGILALNESTAAENYVNITSVTIGGYAPTSASYWTATGDITITTDKSINPSSSVTSVRPYCSSTGFSNFSAGQQSGSDGGASVVVGQKVKSASGNACAIVGASIYNTGNGNAVFGRQHISRKNRSFLAGTGHDTTNGPSEGVAAFGQWSDIKSTTSFAIGNGTSATDRKNSFEISTAGDALLNGNLVLKSPNGTQYRISVNDTGELVVSSM